MALQRHIRFEDEALQSVFVRILEGAAIAYTLNRDGAVLFEATEAHDILDAAHKVRDKQFPWYFLKWKTDTVSERFRVVLIQTGLPFFVEQHEDGTWFVVRRVDRAEHDHLWPRVLGDAGGVSSADD